MRGRNPFEEIEQLLDRMSQGIEGADWPGGGRVSVDVLDRTDEYAVVADLPGYEKDDVDLTFVDGTLRIEAEREVDTEEEGEEDDVRYVRRERSRGSVSRSVRIPDAIDEEALTASYADGVLRVTLPKLGATDEDARRIEID